MFIRVKVFPRSKKEEIKKIKEGNYEVYVRAKAEQGEANSRVIEMITEYFPGCRGIRLLSGATRPNKTLEIIEPIESLFGNKIDKK